MKRFTFLSRAVSTLALAAFFFVTPTLAAPVIGFDQMPLESFKRYETLTYSALVNVFGVEQPTLVHMYVYGPMDDSGAEEHLIASHVYETSGVYEFTWDGKADGYSLPAGDYELRFKSGGLFQASESALRFEFELTDNYFVTVQEDDSSQADDSNGATDGSSDDSDDDSNNDGTADDTGSGDDASNADPDEDDLVDDISFSLQSLEPICAELKVDGVSQKVYEALEEGEHQIDLDELMDSEDLEPGDHEWGLYTDGLACGGSDEDEQLMASGQFTVAEREPDYSELCSIFTDIEPDHPDCPAIGYVYSIGAMTGYPDGTFRPKKILQRDEVSKISLMAFEFYKDGLDYCRGEDPFPDVRVNGDEPDWSAQYVCRGVEKNMITGYEGGEDEGYFRPARLVNIAEFLALFFRNLNETMPADSSASYANIPTGEWFTGFFRFAQDNDLLDTIPSSPTDDVPRLQVAKVLYKLYQLGML